MKKLIYLLPFAVVCCNGKPKEAVVPAEIKPKKIQLVTRPVNGCDELTLADFFSVMPCLDSLVEKNFAAMTADARAAQLIFHATSEQRGANFPFEKARQLYQKNIIGGVLFLKGDVAVFKKQLRLLDSIAIRQQSPKAAYACDCEPTLFHKKFLSADSVHSAPFLKDSLQVSRAAQTIAAYIKQMGININFAPVADAAANKEIINNRSFGTRPAEIVTKSNAFVIATQGSNLVSAVKHFPGHGNIKGDTHKEQVMIDGELTELATFEKIIRQSAPLMVMIGHITVRNNKLYATNGLPATISEVLMTKLLKQHLNYKGIIITDAMRMQAVKTIPDADWKAIKAGADIVLTPVNPITLHQKIKAALLQGEMKERLEHSVKKVIRMKLCLGVLK